MKGKQIKDTLTEDQISMIQNPVQDLREMNDVLEPIKVASAYRSKALVIEARKKIKPDDLSVLDYTELVCLLRQIPTRPKSRMEAQKRIGSYATYCGNCDAGLRKGANYCEKCGQRAYWGE